MFCENIMNLTHRKVLILMNGVLLFIEIPISCCPGKNYSSWGRLWFMFSKVDFKKKYY